MKQAMITIEVLGSMLILFLVIATSFENIKFFNIMHEKKLTYEENYIAVLSLKEKLASTICKQNSFKEGEFNSYTYTATCTKKKELRSYFDATEDDEVSGNTGGDLLSLYEVQLKLTKNSREKEYIYHILTDKKASR